MEAQNADDILLLQKNFRALILYRHHLRFSRTTASSSKIALGKIMPNARGCLCWNIDLDPSLCSNTQIINGTFEWSKTMWLKQLQG